MIFTFADQDEEIYKHHRRNDPETSKEVAKRLVLSGNLTKSQQVVYDAAVARGCSFSPKELAADNGLDYHEVSRRLKELKDAGKLEVIPGIRRDDCRVWRLVDEVIF